VEQNQIHEDIHYIKQMIENNRRALVDNGISYVSIGVFVALGSILSYILIETGNRDMVQIFWLAMMALLIVFNLYIGKRGKKREQKKTFASTVFNATWMACAVPVLFVTVIFMTTNLVSVQMLFALISSVLGIGYFLTGIINDLKFMKWLALGWWAGAVLSIFWSYVGEIYQLTLLFAILFTFFEIIPGIIIYRKWKRVYYE